MKLLTTFIVAIALTGCALDGSDPSDQQDQTKTADEQAPEQQETTATNQAPPPVVDTGSTTNVLKTRH